MRYNELGSARNAEVLNSRVVGACQADFCLMEPDRDCFILCPNDVKQHHMPSFTGIIKLTDLDRILSWLLLSVKFCH
jgi:hypothetical protein